MDLRVNDQVMVKLADVPWRAATIVGIEETSSRRLFAVELARTGCVVHVGESKIRPV